jgi:hypothetical protein
VKEDFYWNWLIAVYDGFNEMCERYNINLKNAGNYEREILIDCSCGASSTKVSNIQKIFENRKIIKLNVKNKIN